MRDLLYLLDLVAKAYQQGFEDWGSRWVKSPDGWLRPHRFRPVWKYAKRIKDRAKCSRILDPYEHKMLMMAYDLGISDRQEKEDRDRDETVQDIADPDHHGRNC